MATSISAILIPCLKSFNQLQERVEQPDYSHEREVSSVSWGDELGRLRIWAANIGAHQTGQSSLDFRLRDASHISNQITKLLQDLNRSLDDILDELSEDETKASEDDETEASWLDDNSTTELQQLHEEVINIIDCLYQLSMLIRKPAQHDLLVGSRMDDKAEFAFSDKEYVRNLHPRSEEQISQHLGRAITRRRKYLSYRERHHKKLEKGIEEVQGIQRRTTGSVTSETIATDFKTPNIDFAETSSDCISQTSYAPSLIHGGRLTIPPPPRDSVGGRPFECPYCFFVIDIKSTRSWNRHIFKDIKPYVCTFSECSIPDRLYDSRHEWYSHETTEHRREDYVCSLCKETLKSSKQYERHVARHLEELALFALPRTEMDDEDSTGTNVQVRPRSAVEGHKNFNPVYDYVLKRKVKEFKELEEKEDIARERFEEERLLEEAKVKDREKLSDAIAEVKEEKKKAEEVSRKMAKKTFGQARYDEESIEKILEQEKTGMEQGHEKTIDSEVSELRRPTYVRVHRKHMSPETLDEYNVPWEWDEPDYILIKRWIPEGDQIILFDHTKKLRKKRKQTRGLDDLGGPFEAAC